MIDVSKQAAQDVDSAALIANWKQETTDLIKETKDRYILWVEQASESLMSKLESVQE